MVVAIHTFYACKFDSIVNIATISVRELFDVAVPLFLAISGFFLGKNNFESKKQMVIFWKKQIPKVYIPVLIRTREDLCVQKKGLDYQWTENIGREAGRLVLNINGLHDFYYLPELLRQTYSRILCSTAFRRLHRHRGIGTVC